MKTVLLKGILPVAIIVAGVFVAVTLKNRAAGAEHQAPEKIPPAVATIQVTPTDMPAELVATGTVAPAQYVTLTSEVSGRVIKLSSQLVPGSRLKKGKIIARIDPRDYRLAIKQEEGRVRQAELELQLEESRGNVAAKEWQMLGGELGADASTNQLALRKPQLDAAQQQTVSAKSGLERARLSLKRTEIRAPFNAIVLDKGVDVGQLVGPSTVVATLMGTDELWVNVSVPVELLSSIDIPGINAEQGSAATITQRIGAEKTVVRQGEVIRLQGQLDNQNRTAKLLVSIDHPFDGEGAELPLLSGAYVEVKIVGRPLTNVFRLPRQVLQEGAYVWLLDQGNQIKRVDVQIGWRDRDEVVITAGLNSGDRIISSLMSFPIEGMIVAPVADESGETAGDSAKEAE